MAASCCFAHGGLFGGRRNCNGSADKVFPPADGKTSLQALREPCHFQHLFQLWKLHVPVALWQVERVRVGQALQGNIVPVLPSLNASGDTIHFQHLITILIIIQLTLTSNTYLVLFGRQPHKPSTSVERFFMYV